MQKNLKYQQFSANMSFCEATQNAYEQQEVLGLTIQIEVKYNLKIPLNVWVQLNT